MTDTPSPTPAQIAYDAYMAVLALAFPMDFAALPVTYRRAWDAAAQAVRLDLLADSAWARQAPSSRWQVVPQTEEDAP
jgi:hypothetical protein